MYKLCKINIIEQIDCREILQRSRIEQTITSLLMRKFEKYKIYGFCIYKKQPSAAAYMIRLTYKRYTYEFIL